MRAVYDVDNDIVMDLLRKKQAPVNYQDPQTGVSALHTAAASGNRFVVRLIEENGQCNFLIRDSITNRLPSQWARDEGRDPQLSAYLRERELEQGRTYGIVPYPDRDGGLPIQNLALLGEKLIDAVSLSDRENVVSLIKEGAPVNYGNALHFAAAVHDIYIVCAFLRTEKCDFLSRDYLGRLPSQWAENAGHEEHFELLSKKEAEQARSYGLTLSSKGAQPMTSPSLKSVAGLDY